jgi:hypothetical protein
MADRLSDLASVVRSKNAGPFTLTLDVILPDADTYGRVIGSGRINRARIAELYRRTEDEIDIIEYSAARAIKITMPRAFPSGDVGDTDVYGAQQHAPLLDIEIP